MGKRDTKLSQIETTKRSPSVALTGSTYQSHATSAFAAPLDQPLALDLDLTLIRTDLLFESLAAALKRNPLIIFLALFWAVRGKAVLKRKLVRYLPLSTDFLPVNERVVDLAEGEVRAGRRVILATAADELIARRIATRFPFIDGVVASDGAVNLKGETKARELERRFPQGFIYVADSKADLPVWAKASAIVLVEPSRTVARRAAALGKPMMTLEATSSRPRVLAKALRIKQWVKNGLIFVPLALAGMALSPMAWMDATGAFLALGMVASATYLLNDMLDLADDRQHWSKKNRPFASGALRLDVGMLWMVALVVLGLATATIIDLKVLAVIIAYMVMTLAYSFRLKRVPILDVATLAVLFTIRLFLGVMAIGAVVSPWLFAFSMALFLSLSVAKRHTEVVRMVLHGKTNTAGRGYIARDEPLLLAMGLGAAASAIVLFSLYLMGDAFRAAMYTAHGFLWVAPVVLFLWLGRVWLLSQRGELDDDPVAFAVKDKTSIALGGVLCLAFLLAISAGQFV